MLYNPLSPGATIFPGYKKNGGADGWLIVGCLGGTGVQHRDSGQGRRQDSLWYVYVCPLRVSCRPASQSMVLALLPDSAHGTEDAAIHTKCVPDAYTNIVISPLQLTRPSSTSSPNPTRTRWTAGGSEAIFGNMCAIGGALFDCGPSIPSPNYVRLEIDGRSFI